MLALNLRSLFSPMIHFSITLLCPILIWILLVSFFLAVCLAVRDGITRLRQLHQVPCSHCAFYTGDYRLKCTVHPCKALSEEAIDCLDYEPVSSEQQVRSPIKAAPKKRLTLIREFIF
ncbi:hypothetical protein BST81_18575 [Leptolyngbya sp. 'hensonii']|nr:hypothetical protein BST81_18575 [Leptolyngbya sp. 'hensonii']